MGKSSDEILLKVNYDLTLCSLYLLTIIYFFNNPTISSGFLLIKYFIYLVRAQFSYYCVFFFFYNFSTSF